MVCFPLAPAALPVFVALPLMQALQILDVFWSQHDPTRNSSSRQYAPNSQLPPPPHPSPITYNPFSSRLRQVHVRHILQQR